eukprot:2477824-Pyramimonas_sp.AAC.2
MAIRLFQPFHHRRVELSPRSCADDARPSPPLWPARSSRRPRSDRGPLAHLLVPPLQAAFLRLGGRGRVARGACNGPGRTRGRALVSAGYERSQPPAEAEAERSEGPQGAERHVGPEYRSLRIVDVGGSAGTSRPGRV